MKIHSNLTITCFTFADEKSKLIKKSTARTLDRSQQSSLHFEQIIAFLQHLWNVDLGTGHVSRTLCAELINFMEKEWREENITKKLNTRQSKYLSIHGDVSAAAKTSEEKEAFLIKYSDNGVPSFVFWGWKS